MSAQDRLEALLAKHVFGWGWTRDGYCRGCSWRSVLAPDDAASAHRRHVAAVIAGTDDLAVIETRPVKVYREDGEWMCETDNEVGSVLPVGAKDWEIDEIEGQLAEAIAQVRAVRAARAAEAVSNRG